MSRRFYVLFCELNSKKPIFTQNRKSAINSVQNKKFTNMISLTTHSKGLACLKQRQNQYNLMKNLSVAKRKYQVQKQQYQKYFDSLDNSLTNLTEKISPKSQPFLSKDIITKMFKNLLNQMDNDFYSKQVVQKFKPQSIISSIYRNKIFPQQTYKAYLSFKANQNQQELISRKCMGYYFTKRQQIFHQRTFIMKKQWYIENQFKVISYLIIDAWLNGIRKLQINCDNKCLFYIWQDLINKKQIKQPTQQQQTCIKVENKNQTEKTSNQNLQTNQIDSVSMNQLQNGQDCKIEQNQNKKDLKEQFSRLNYQYLFIPMPLNHKQIINQDPENDHQQEFQKLQETIRLYNKDKFKKYIKALIFLINKMDSVQLKQLPVDDNQNVIQLINERIKSQVLRKRVRDRKRKQFEKMKQQELGKIPHQLHIKRQLIKSKLQQDWLSQNPPLQDQ